MAVNYTYENNYYSFDMSAFEGCANGDKVTVRATNL